MKKLYTILMLICFALSAYAETVFTFSTAADINQTKDGITVGIAQGSGSKAPMLTTDYETQKPEMRLYLGNTITISGENLTNIQLVCAKSSASNKDYAGLSASVPELVSGGVAIDKNDWKVDKWTGSATSVVFTLTENGQRRIQRIVIDGDSITFDPEPELPTAEDLDPDYTYDEPTIVNVPDTQFFKNEYAFIDNNVLVSCPQGSIMKATDTTVAYFNCNANYSLTFTATQPIKGIAIDGFVRKAFHATCDKGDIQFLTDEDQDMEGWPALVITDIDATSVTLSCPKQLRCYAVRVFFEENPDPIEEEVADTTDIYPTSAIAEDYSNDTTYSQEGAYSYWVKLSSENTYPKVYLDLYTAVQGDLSGTYTLYDYNVGDYNHVIFSEAEDDYVTAFDIDVTIEAIEGGYKIDGVLTCWEKGKEWDDESDELVYRFSYEGAVDFILPEGIDTIESAIKAQKVLQNGQLYIIRNGRTYTAEGAVVK